MTDYNVTVLDDVVVVYTEEDGIVLNLGNDEYEVVEPEFAANVVFPLLPIINNCVQGVEATFMGGFHRWCLGTVLCWGSAALPYTHPLDVKKGAILRRTPPIRVAVSP